MVVGLTPRSDNDDPQVGAAGGQTLLQQEGLYLQHHVTTGLGTVSPSHFYLSSG